MCFIESSVTAYPLIGYIHRYRIFERSGFHCTSCLWAKWPSRLHHFWCTFETISFDNTFAGRIALSVRTCRKMCNVSVCCLSTLLFKCHFCSWRIRMPTTRWLEEILHCARTSSLLLILCLIVRKSKTILASYNSGWGGGVSSVSKLFDSSNIKTNF